MQGKTHLVIGVALSLAVMRPSTMPALVGGAGIAALGSVISDIDAGQSGAGHDATKVVASIVIAGVLVLLADLYFHLGLYARFLRRGRETGFMLPLLLFILFAAIGMLTRHRSFMHSLPAMILFTACIWFMQRAMAPYFAIAYASHLLLDLTNRRGMRLFFPSRKLVSMKLEVMQVVDQVKDVTLRLILEKRYLSFLSWERISVDLGYTVRWTLIRHEEALRTVQELLDELGDFT